MPTQMTYVQAQQYAHERDVIARVNTAGTRVWFYTGEEAHKGTWLELGAARIDKGGWIDRRTVEILCAKVRK